MFKKILPLLLLYCCHAAAQNTGCEVKADSLRGSYEGNCRNGKADGLGKAVGADTYEGNFKNGYPDGAGKYTWRAGDIYTGNFKKGMREGKGTYTDHTTGEITTGFWKKDRYYGAYEKPYELYNISNTVTSQSVNKIEATGASVTVSMESGSLAIANIDNFQLTGGDYVRTNKREMNKIKIIEFQQVRFPLRIRFMIDGGPFDFEIFEAGTWQVTITLL